jgi:late competence protein required for DNA uptake (superfamily II DNA/RNA helicase)
MRTRLSICRKKAVYQAEHEAIAAATMASITLRHYRCDRCGQYHLTSRTKGKRIPKPPLT